jgi:cytochrome c-type biogenesis protein CcmF
MESIQYLNEHLLPGQLGNFLVILSFVSAIFSGYTYYLATKHPEAKSYLRLGRWSFTVHAVAVIGIIGTLLFILFNHLYEYKYAWEHLNNAMPLRYIFSCMWEGQEGSFLLWTFWHVIIGLCLIRWAKDWEPWVMMVLAVVEVFLSSMLLGVYFGDFQFGSNPFTLLREASSNVGLPWTMNPDYLSLKPFMDGKGLNPLLQNYWMTIHPPTLFLGFAATVVPFLYAIAGLWRKDLRGWMRPAIPWSFFGIMILGTGILMGGAWAYEALGFGGFWAWDPVENASLVPWLILVAAAHLLVINQRKDSSTFAALTLSVGAFILVLYSTFLTRSGVLGDSSVHSFVDSGILAQLLVYLLFFVALTTYLLLPSKLLRTIYVGVCGILFVVGIGNIMTYKTYKTAEELDKLLPGQDTMIPGLCLVFILLTAVMSIIAYRKGFRKPGEEEEALWSREFWMFIGALILVIMGVQITVVTSINVGNIFMAPFESMFASLHKSTGWGVFESMSKHNFSAPSGDDRFDVYHKFQIPFTFILFLIIAFGQYLKYKNTELKSFLRQLVLSLIITIVLTGLTAWAIHSNVRSAQLDIMLLVLVGSCYFAMVANANYAWKVLKGKLDIMGASVAHFGFAMLILGAVISTWQSYFVSRSDVSISKINKEFNDKEDMLMLKGDTALMGDYFVHYKDKIKSGDRILVTVEYFDVRPKTYSEGEYVQHLGFPFRALKTHTSTGDFLSDVDQHKYWTAITPGELDSHAQSHLANWTPGVPGERVFVLEPTILQSPKGNSREPSIKHFLGHDLYTFIKYTDTEIKVQEEQGYLEPKTGIVKVGEEVSLTEVITMKIDSLVTINDIPEGLPEGTRGQRAFLTLTSKQRTEQLIVPMVDVSGTPVPYPIESKTFRMLLALQNKPEGIELTVQKHSSLDRDMLIMTAQVFPQINVLWIGCLVMVIGTIMAIRHRFKIAQRKA